MIVVNSVVDFDAAAADSLMQQLRQGGVIGLATGRTTGAMHRLVADAFTKGPFDISNVTFFALDEVTGIEDTNPWACRAKLKHEVLDALGVDDDHFLSFPTYPEKCDDACTALPEALQARGGIDLLYLGLGENGHLGFNQPGTPFDSKSWISTMDEGLENRIREDCGLDSSVKLGGITLGLSELMAAKRIILLVKGESKREILKQVLEGPVTEDVPASILQRHPDCTLIADSAAMGE